MMEAKKKALVTDAAEGVGRGIALRLAREGYFLAVSGRGEAGAGETARLVREAGGSCVCLRADLADCGQAEALVGRAAAELGGLDLLVNNEACGYETAGLHEIPDETLDRMIGLNFRNSIALMRAAALYMAERGVRGGIVNVTSARGTRAHPGDGLYGGLRAGINRAAESFALDLAPYGIRVNCVAPGVVRGENTPDEAWLSPKIPLQRAGTPEDVAAAVAWLASEEAAYVTGVTLRVDGGLILPTMPDNQGDNAGTDYVGFLFTGRQAQMGGD